MFTRGPAVTRQIIDRQIVLSHLFSLRAFVESRNPFDRVYELMIQTL